MYKELFHNKKAVIFDLDGTLADTHYLWDQSLLNVLSSMGTYISEVDIPRGMFITDKWEAVIHENNIKTKFSLNDIVKHNYTEYLNLFQKSGLEVKEGFWSFAAELKQDKNFKLAMVTNTVKEVGEQVMRMLELQGVFDVEIYGDEIKNPKPHPEIYKLAAKKLEMKARNILVFEDSVVGAKSSVAAGMDTVIIWDGEIMRKEYPNEVKGFVTDFTAFPGNMDATFEEEFRNYVEEVEKRKQGTNQ